MPDAIWQTAKMRAEPRVQLMIDLGAQLGLRRAEIAAVHRKDVIPDFDGWALDRMERVAANASCRST